MNRMISQQRRDEFTEPEIEKERSTVCSRPGTNFSDLEIRECSDETVGGEILSRTETGQLDA